MTAEMQDHVKRRETIAPDLPIRVCTQMCRYRSSGGCDHYKEGRVSDGQLCYLDMLELKKWISAYQGGDVKVVRRAGGAIQGAVVLKIYEIIDKITEEGLTFSAPKIDRNGEPVIVNGEYIWEYKEHPLFKRLTELVRICGVSPHQFGLIETDKVELQGNIQNVENMNIQVIMAQQEKRTDEFRKAIEAAGVMREKDPVYQRFVEEGNA